MRNRPLARVCLAAVSAVAALCGMEFWVRKSPPSPFPLPSEEYLRFLSENNGSFFQSVRTGARGELVQTPTVWKVVKGQRFTMKKPAGVRRILVVGESSADMLGRELSEAVKDGGSSARIEVMDCANGAGSLEMIQRRFDECVRYEPDAVIVVVGHNVFIQHPDYPPWLNALRLYARSSELLSRTIERVTPEVHRASPRQRLAALRGFIADVAGRTRRAAIPALVVTLPSNLRYAPASTPEERGAPDYLAAVYLYRSGRRSRAIEALSRAVEKRPTAIWHFMLGDWLDRQGDGAGALRHLRAACDLDSAKMRATSDVNRLLRERAAAEGIGLFDAERWTARRAPRHIPGWESFLDPQHVKPNLFRAWALESLAILKVTDWNDGRLDDARARRSRTPFFPDHALAWIWAVSPEGGDFTVSNMNSLIRARPELAAGVAESYIRSRESNPQRQHVERLDFAEGLWQLGRRTDALKINDAVRAAEPGWADPDVQRGLFLLEAGQKPTALSSFLEAQRKSPGRPDAAYFAAALAADQEAEARALSAAPRAPERRPSTPNPGAAEKPTPP